MKTSLLFPAIISVAIGLTSLPAFAEPETTASEIENSRFTFAGEVNADGTLIRSGPSESDYAAMKLDKGAKITVVGMRFDWLKVTPPEGSFCLVPQAYIERSGDGSIGKVGQNPATVRIGSSLTQQKHKVPMRLDPGTSVRIIGSVDEFYKIAPPTGVYLFVDKKFVNPIKRLDEKGNPQPEVTTNTEATTNTPTDTASTESQPTDTNTTSTESTTSSDPHGRFVATSDGNNAQIPPNTNEQPTESSPSTPIETATNNPTEILSPTLADDSQLATNVNETTTDTTPERPKVSGEPTRVLIERLQRLEDQYTEASKWPIGEQPVEQMLADYQVLAAEPNLPPASKQVAEFRVQSLLIRKDALDSYRESQVAIADAQAKRQDLAAEQAELEQRYAETQVTTYTALGRLSISSLQAGSESLYRLVDPANGRLVIYVRTNDPTILANLDQFVGITGEVIEDPTLKLTYIRPAQLELVDPARVNNRVFAQYTPNSFLITPVAGDSAMEN